MIVRSEKMEKEAIKEVVENIVQLSDTILTSIVPEDAKKHFRLACKEALLGMIAIIDHAEEKAKESSSKDFKQEKPTTHTIDITE
jgi:hypothetical protein